MNKAVLIISAVLILTVVLVIIISRNKKKTETVEKKKESLKPKEIGEEYPPALMNVESLRERITPQFEI